MTDRSRYHLALALTVVLAVITISACWFVATAAGMLAALAIGIVLLPCLAFCAWRTRTSRARLRPDLIAAGQEQRP